MARGDIKVKKADTIFDELDRLRQAVSQRAYDLFRNGGRLSGNELTHWLTAEQELISKPPIELRQKAGTFEVLAAVPGVEPKALDVQITPDDVLIQAETAHEHTADAGMVHVCEFEGGKIFRSIHFPQKIDPNSAKAEYQNGILRLTAAIVKVATAKKVEVNAA